MHTLDQLQLRRANDRIAAQYDETDFFCAAIRGRLLERLEYMNLSPRRVLDMGTGTGGAAAALRGRYPDALVIGLDWSEQMLKLANTADTALCADSHQLPLADASIDLIVSNLMLPGCASPEAIFAEARRVLRNPGLFLFSTLGPDTLKELRRAWSGIDTAPHVHTFADMHNIGDALVKAGFREPVMDVEKLTVTYAEIHKLIADLRAVAATNLASERRRGLTSPYHWARFINALDNAKDPAGRLPITFEVVTGQAWSGTADMGVPLEDGEAHFPLSRLKY